MTVFALLFQIVVVALLAYFATWVVGKLAPNHPPIVDSIIWVIAVLVIVFITLQAFGLLTSGPLVPRVGIR